MLNKYALLRIFFDNSKGTHVPGLGLSHIFGRTFTIVNKIYLKLDIDLDFSHNPTSRQRHH